MNQSEQVNELFKALCAVQSALVGAKKDAANPFFRSKYADLESCWEAARSPLANQGLCVVQTCGTEDGETGLYTTLGHVSGQWMRGFLPLNMKAQDPQGQGSAITYARRYAFAAIIGLVQTDDDGEAAQGRLPRISADQPDAGDGHTPDQGYVINFGQWNKKTLEQVMRDQGPDAIRGYVEYLENTAIKKNKPILPDSVVGNFIDEASRFLAAFENAPQPNEGDFQA